MSLLFERVTPINEATGFEAYQYSIAPPWLQATYGGGMMRALGKVKDAIAERASQAAELRMPSFCSSGALAYNGADRYLERGIGETDASYREWLLQAWQWWEEAGTRRSVTRQLAHFLQVDESKVHLFELWPYQASPATRVVAPPSGYTTTPAPGWWNGDADTAQWSRFWLIVDAATPWPVNTPNWGSGQTWGGGSTWGSAATVSQVAQTMDTICKWKSAHAQNAATVWTNGSFLLNWPNPQTLLLNTGGPPLNSQPAITTWTYLLGC